MSSPSQVRVRGPLEAFAPGFADELRGLGYTPVSAVFQLQLMAHASRWLREAGLGPDALTGDVVERFVAERRAAGYTNYVTVRAMAPLLGYLRAIGVAPAPLRLQPATPAGRLLERFGEYLTIERGVADGTVVDYVHAVRPFVDAIGGGEERDLQSLTAADVTAFVVARCPCQSRGAAKMTVTALRSLLGFLHVEGLIARSLVGAVPSAASWRLSGLPRALEPEQVRRLLDSCDRSARTGRRDFAILTMLVRLGLRAGEVAGLTLEDVDWRAGELVVVGKGRRAERLPLPVDVGEAITSYLRDGRPASAQDRSLFVRVKAPHRGLTSAGVSQVVVSAGRRAGLGQIHAHRLRHSAATQMLRAGGSLEEIGQVLRHRAALTTAIYAKVDRDALRGLARPWPGARS
ncbi:MAG: tyrosine-type recombinase/integrase [Thermoleophilaceae bacterium]|nr:tyrosine-type recombinase/integrase [Thermoleophilaceae bacterium]